MGRAIFISYRRDDTEGEAGRLFDDLVRAYGEGCVFMDVAGISPGIDFRKAIDDNVATCGVLLAVLGPRWATVTGSSGKPRLEDENDFVRLEIASALARNIAVIPVLVHGATMPHPDSLPDSLKDLAYRNSVEITHARWNSDVALLTKALSQYVTSSGHTDTEPVHATVAVQLPPANAPVEPPAAARSSKTLLVAAVSVAALLLIVIVAFFLLRHSDHSPAALAGVWTSPSPGGRNSLAKLDIAVTGNQLQIHAWGDCASCDWGTQPSTYTGPRVYATWRPPAGMEGEVAGRVAFVNMVREGDQLDVTVTNTFPAQPATQRRLRFNHDR